MFRIQLRFGMFILGDVNRCFTRQLRVEALKPKYYKLTRFSTTIDQHRIPLTVSLGNNISKLKEEDLKAFKESDFLPLLEDLSSNARFTGKQRISFLSELWEALNNSTIPEEKHFIYKLKCLLKSRVNIAPKLFLKEVKECGIEPSVELLKLLLKVVCEHGDQGYVSSVVTSMKSRNYAADDTIFSCLVTSHAVRGDFNSARQVLETMRESGIEPGNYTYTSLIRAAAMAGDYAGLHTMLSQAAEKKVVLTNENIISIIETVVRFKKEHLLISLKSSLDDCSSETILDLANSLLYSGFGTGGYSILKFIKDPSLTEYCHQYCQNMLLAGIPLQQMIAVGKKMFEDGTYGRALYDILEEIMRAEKCSDAIMVFQSLHELKQPIRPHFFWPLIASKHRSSSDQGVFEILETMQTLDVKPNAETLEEMVLPRLALDDDEAVFKRLQDVTNLTISQLIIPFLVHLLKSGLFRQALELCDRYQSSISDESIAELLLALGSGFKTSKDHTTVGKILKSLQIQNIGEWLLMIFSSRKKLSINEIILLCNELKKAGCSISRANEKDLLRLMVRYQGLTSEVETCFRSMVQEKENEENAPIPLSPIKHPSKMSAEELECHLKELEEKGMNTRGVLRRLVQAHSREGNVTAARRAYKQMLDLGVELSPGILSAMLNINIKAREVDDALEFLRKLEEEYLEFQVDDYKLIDLAALLVSLGRYEDGADILRQRPQKSRNRKALSATERNCWELLNSTANNGKESEVEEMQKILLTNRYCEPTNVILGPSVRVHLLSGDVNSAVNKFCNYVGKYRKTPLQQEVTTAALLLGDTAMVSKVMKAIEQIHGIPSARAVLISSLAIQGDLTSLRLYLIESQVDLNNEKIRSQIERMCQLGQISALETLLKASWDLPNVDVDFIICRILHNYQRKGDVDGAIKCWELLESKGVKLSEKNRSSLASLIASTSKS